MLGRYFGRGLWVVAAINIVAWINSNEVLAELNQEELSIAVSLRLTPDMRADPTNGLELNDAAKALGQYLFNDVRLSGNANISCASCHIPAKNFGENRRLSIGALGHLQRKTPSLRGVARFEWFFLDGRADTLWGQALEVIENPSEMHGSRRSVALLLINDPHYRRLLEPLIKITRIKIDDHSLSVSLVNSLYVLAGKSLAAYLKSQDFSPSRFDHFVDEASKSGGRAPADFSDSEVNGFKLFVGSARCVLCHRGSSFSDGQFHNLGLPPDLSRNKLDTGRYDAAKKLSTREFSGASKYSDAPQFGKDKNSKVIADGLMWGAFKTPSLRNSAKNSSYMHDGRYETLEEVVRFYSTLEGQQPGHHQEGVLTTLNLSDSEIKDLIAFLHTLDSETASQAITQASAMKR